MRIGRYEIQWLDYPGKMKFEFDRQVYSTGTVYCFWRFWLCKHENS